LRSLKARFTGARAGALFERVYSGHHNLMIKIAAMELASMFIAPISTTELYAAAQGILVVKRAVD
jgi:hypothetical protein